MLRVRICAFSVELKRQRLPGLLVLDFFCRDFIFGILLLLASRLLAFSILDKTDVQADIASSLMLLPSNERDTALACAQ